MNKAIFVLTVIVLVAIFASCKQSADCDSNSICVTISKYTYNNKLKLCIKLKNNSDQNYYITGFSNLVFGLNVQKEQNGIKSDSRFEFYWAPNTTNDSMNVSVFEIPVVPNYSEERKQCNVENYGPIARQGFLDTIAQELLKCNDLQLFNYWKSTASDSLENFKKNLSCIFIPSHGEVSDGIEICLGEMECEKLQIQFIYPNNNLADYSLWFANNASSMKTELERLKVNYPDTLMGFVHYTRPITSDIVVISK